MVYEVYKDRVLSMVNASKSQGSGISVEFENVDGKFYARISDGTLLIGYADSARISVKFDR